MTVLYPAIGVEVDMGGNHRQIHLPSGPAYVPPEKEWPPVDWGDTLDWEERVRRWRSSPAKERRSYPGERQMYDPAMPVVATILEIGEVRWSSGHGRWSPTNFQKRIGRRSATLHRGYWLLGPHDSDPRFIGETLDEAHSTIENILEERALRMHDYAKRQAIALQIEAKHRAAMLQDEADSADEMVESVSSTFRRDVAQFESHARPRVLDDIIAAITAPGAVDSSSSA